MDDRPRVLVVGSRALEQSVLQAAPACAVVCAESPLEGLWDVGNQLFDVVLVSTEAGPNVERAVRKMREVSPDLRIVVCCPAAAEPVARAALREGANDYIIEPLRREDLDKALGVEAPRRRGPRASEPETTLADLDRAAGVVRTLLDGPLQTLEHFAGLIGERFGALGVLIECDSHVAVIGDARELVLEEPILAPDGALLGRIGLARRHDGPYSSALAATLPGYAQLVRAAMATARAQEHWRELAWTDDLTSLRNRRYFEQRADELLADGVRKRQRALIVLFDVDDLKHINQRHGRAHGDRLLQDVAALLRRCTRKSDILARVADDTFAAFLWEAERPRAPGSQFPGQTAAFQERIRRALSELALRSLADPAAPVRLHAGLAAFPWDGATREQLMSAAEGALREAQRAGPGTLELTAAGGAPGGDGKSA